MEVRIQYQGIEGSPWMSEYLEGKLARLERYLASTALIEVELISEGDRCFTHFSVQTPTHEFNFDKEGCDIFEAFTTALDEAAIFFRREHMRVRGKFHQQLFDLTEP